MDPDRFSLLTFDCYGTLVDWEKGILDAARPVCRAHGADPSDGRLLASFAAAEHVAQGGPYRSYRAVLADTLCRMGEALGFRPDREEQDAFAGSPGRWPVFPDTVEALGRLGRRYRLGIVSNVDDDLFAQTQRRLGTDFDWVVTAEQVRSYKPAQKHFDEMVARSGVTRERTLHVAQSLFHDIAPASALGCATLWVNRPSKAPGGGATPPADARPDAQVRDMAEAARLLAGED